MESETKKTRSITGRGTIRSLTNLVKIVADDSSVYEYGYEDVKDVAIPPKGKEWKNVCFRTSEDGSKLYGVGPWSGTHIVRFREFSHMQDQPPAPRQDEGGERVMEKNGKILKFYAKPKLYFLAVLEITDGEYAGCVAVYPMDYLFQPGSGGMTKILGGPKPKMKLESFMVSAGFDMATDNVRWSDNILPELETILQSRSESFLAVFEEGKVVSISDMPSGMKPAKRTAKKG